VIDPTMHGDRPRHAADSAAKMLHAFCADSIVQLSNNPDKGAQLAHLGTIASQVPTALHLTGSNAAYLATKARRGGHDLLSGSLEHAAESRRDACPLPGPPGPGFEAR